MGPRVLILLVAVAAFALGIFLALGPGKPEPAEPTGGYVLDEPRALPPFTLVDDAGASFTQDDFRGHWSMLYFGFTYCPDICPSSLSVMAQVKSALDERDEVDDRYYLVSVDPDRDTPERLKEYVQYFDPEFRGLTGDFDQLDQVTRAAGAVYKVPDAPEDEDYLVAHSSTLTVIDPDGRLKAIFTSPFDPTEIAKVMRRITRD